MDKAEDKDGVPAKTGRKEMNECTLETMKTCTTCKQEKSADQFFRGRQRCKLCFSLQISELWKQLRQSVILDIYGGRCDCGFDDIRALTIDHKYGGGSKERKNGLSGRTLYRMIRDNEVNQDNYQVLCCNCQSIKRIVNKEHACGKKTGEENEPDGPPGQNK